MVHQSADPATDLPTVAEAWQQALYGPTGFYRGPSGPAAHFATSAQGIPGVDELLAELVLALVRREGLSRVVDFACGRGELLHRLAELDPRLRLTGVDVVERPDDLPAGVGWVRSPGGAELPGDLEDLDDTLLIAHEWLDVVPADLMDEDGRLLVAGPDGLVPGPAASAAQRAWAQRHWPGAGPVELGDTRDAGYAGLRDRLASGLLVCVDYGHVAAERPPEPTLTGFRDGRECEPRFDGSTDVTAHVSMDSLGAPTLLRQADLARELLEVPGRPDHGLAHTDPAAYVAGLRRRGAWSAFTDPRGLGGFWWSLEPVSRSSDAARR